MSQQGVVGVMRNASEQEVSGQPVDAMQHVGQFLGAMQHVGQPLGAPCRSVLFQAEEDNK